MFLFHIPFELSWKHKGIIKQWLYKYFYIFICFIFILFLLYYHFRTLDTESFMFGHVWNTVN